MASAKLRSPLLPAHMAARLPALVSTPSWVLRTWHALSLATATLGVVFGIGLIAAIVIWWVLALLWPGQMNWRANNPATRAQTAWLFIGLVRLASARRWLNLDPTLSAISLYLPVLALPLLAFAGWSLFRLTRAS